MLVYTSVTSALAVNLGELCFNELVDHGKCNPLYAPVDRNKEEFNFHVVANNDKDRGLK